LHSLAILDDQEKYQGILTSKLIFDYLADSNHNPQQFIKEIKLESLFKISDKVPLEKAIKEMKRKHSYKIIVFDEKGKDYGVLTETEILKKITANS